MTAAVSLGVVKRVQNRKCACVVWFKPPVSQPKLAATSGNGPCSFNVYDSEIRRAQIWRSYVAHLHLSGIRSIGAGIPTWQ